jgi:hypothetical protein
MDLPAPSRVKASNPDIWPNAQALLVTNVDPWHLAQCFVDREPPVRPDDAEDFLEAIDRILRWIENNI